MALLGSTLPTPVAVFNTPAGGALWLATHRQGSASAVTEFSRNKQDIFWKGISETLRMTTTGSDPLKWRRIVFELEGGPGALIGIDPTTYIARQLDFDNEAPLSGAPTNPFNLQGLSRYNRPMYPLASTSDEFATFVTGFFQGSPNIDYNQYLTAKVDRRIKVRSDVTRSIQSGNDSGVIKVFKTYLPINKTMRYADAESGSLISYDGFAAFDSPQNDIYVWDYFEGLTGSETVLNVSGTSVAYWHEK